MSPKRPFASWLRPDGRGLYCVPGDFHIDPHAAVERAVITHGHSDHARPGHRAVLATADTIAIMKLRLGSMAGHELQALAYGEPLKIGNVTVRLMPAGHILGSAQVVIEYDGQRAVVIPPKLRGVWKWNFLGIFRRGDSNEKEQIYGSADHVCAETG